jgi:hypothetical protein
MTRSQKFAYRFRFALLVLGLGCFAVGVWLLFGHPGVDSGALGCGLIGTPLVAFPVYGDGIIFLAIFLLAQWAFLRPRLGWTVRLTRQGRPMWLSLLVS